MNSLLLHRIVKSAPYAMAVFSVVLMAHGVHLSGDPGGPGGPNVLHLVRNDGDPGGPGGPN